MPRPLVDGRHEPGAPVPRAAGHLGSRIVLHHDERGQVRVLGAQAVAHPAPQRGAAGEGRAGVHLADAADVVQPVGPARADHREVIGAGGDVRQPVGDPDARSGRAASTSAATPSAGTILAHGRDHRLEARRQRPAGEPVQLGLGVERSMWLGPPSMNRKITLLAVAGRRHGADPPPGVGVASVPAVRSLASRSPRARAPKPAPACSSQSRRVIGVTRWGFRDFMGGIRIRRGNDRTDRPLASGPSYLRRSRAGSHRSRLAPPSARRSEPQCSPAHAGRRSGGDESGRIRRIARHHPGILAGDRRARMHDTTTQTPHATSPDERESSDFIDCAARRFAPARRRRIVVNI